MSLDIKGQKCVVCNSHFEKDDDVVYCPICGAPHHRSCYNSVGKCGLDELHGTENQYGSKKEAVEQEPQKNTTNEGECAFCHAKFENDAKVCPYCGRPRIGTNFIQIDFLGGVDPEQDIDGIPAKEARDFVAVNTHRYIPKFASGRKVSWNWMAFIFPQAWFFSRKMYKLGVVILTLLIVATIFTLPALEFINSSLPEQYTSQEYMQNFYSVLPEINWVHILLLFVGIIMHFSVRIFGGIFGDYWYKKYVVAKIKEREESKLEKDDYNRKYGGVNLLLAAIALLVFYNLPTLLRALI